MTLAAEWQIVVPTQRQVELTNQDGASATTVNTTVLGRAAAYAAARFAVLSGLTLDLTNDAHLSAGVAGVTYFLESFRCMPGAPGIDAAKKAFEDECTALAMLLPAGTSVYEPSEADDGALPAFDPDHLGGATPQPPRLGGSSGWGSDVDRSFNP